MRTFISTCTAPGFVTGCRAWPGYPSADPRARAAAEIFGAPVIWGHPPPIDPGRTVSFAGDHGIPWLYTEARGAGRIHPEDLRMMTRGIR